jgi:hypothetical protein
MKYINPKSRRGIVNKFADFILCEIQKEKKHKTIIEVSDFGNFMVVAGKTESKTLIDLTEIKDKFYEENKQLMIDLNYERLNTIDLIKYDVSYWREFYEYFFEFHNTSHPSFHDKVLNYVYNHPDTYFNSLDYKKELVFDLEYGSQPETNSFFYENFICITSEFPYGFGLDTGRAHFYYSEYICNQLFSSIKTDKINFKITDVKDDNSDLDIQIISTSPYLTEQIKSMVLDVFDFNIKRFINTTLKGLDLSKEIDSQLDSKLWLVKDKISELYII